MTSRSWIFGRTHSYCLSPDAPHPFRNLPTHVISVGATWANGQPFSNHAKLVAVDDEAFYIGSQNLYPGRLHELGVIVENRDAANELNFTYLRPTWEWVKGRRADRPGHGGTLGCSPNAVYGEYGAVVEAAGGRASQDER
jgi:hypothetical protein